MSRYPFDAQHDSAPVFLVLPDDDGIRPAGRPDECFYCWQRVGSPHEADCVMLVRDSTYDVFVRDERVGTWHVADPAAWSAHDCNSHKNESSWCKSNMLSHGVLDVPDDVRSGLEAGDECVCGIVRLVITNRADEVRRSAD